jgi:hypothetical protein
MKSATCTVQCFHQQQLVPQGSRARDHEIALRKTYCAQAKIDAHKRTQNSAAKQTTTVKAFSFCIFYCINIILLLFYYYFFKILSRISMHFMIFNSFLFIPSFTSPASCYSLHIIRILWFIISLFYAFKIIVT